MAAWYVGGFYFGVENIKALCIISLNVIGPWLISQDGKEENTQGPSHEFLI
jgi:hypothetical protein